MFELNGVRKKHERENGRDFVLEDVCLSLARRDFAVVTGKSGSGKTTLLSVIAGLLRPDAGQIRLEGEELTGLGDTELSRIRGSRIGFIPQGAGILFDLSVLQNVCLPAWLASKRVPKAGTKRAGDVFEKANMLLGRVGLAGFAEESPRCLSGGELRRVAVARGLIGDPVLLVADEPTGDLDPEAASGVMRLFREIADDGAAVLVSTHDRENLKWANRHFAMDDGRLSEIGK